jgi:tight adherence protein C
VIVGLFFILAFLFVWQLSKSIFGHRIAVSGRFTSLQGEANQRFVDTDAELLQGTLLERLFRPLWNWVISKVDGISPSGWRLEEQKRLARSGLSSKITLGEWLAWRCVSLIFGTVTFGMVALSQTGIQQLLYFLIGSGLGWYFPIIYLKQKSAKRQKDITRALPDVLDLLTVSIEAGLGFDAGVAKVVEKSEGALAEEFGKTLHEIRMGKGRRDALRDLGRRTGNRDLIGFVSAIVQADQLGVSIGNVLRIQSDDLRGRRKARAEEQAMKAPIKILFPLILFIFPSLFIIILGPAIITIFDTLK